LLRKISGSVWEAVTEGYRKLHDEGFHVLYLYNQIKVDEMNRAFGASRREGECISGVWRGSLKKDANCMKNAWMGGEYQSDVIEEDW